MRRTISILVTSFKMALQELAKNKLRTFLSLFGVTIGIFCIIGVLATVNSLEQNIQSEIKELGTNTIYIDKWDYSGGPDYPWWKYANRPTPKYEELNEIMRRTPTAQYASYVINVQDNAEAGGNVLQGIRLYGITPSFPVMQPVEIEHGRLLTESEFAQGSNVAVIGNEVAEKLFGEPQRAVGKYVTVRGRKNAVVGVIKKQGQQLINSWQFDQSVVTPYHFARTIMDEERADPVILVQSKPEISSKVLQDDLRGAMRGIRKLSPMQEDNFALNDVAALSDVLSQAFVSINIGGWAIGALSFIVGIFGVANIMFVTVKERTSQIGLKKAIGAKSGVILAEFLAESAFLCIMGGLIGLMLVFLLTQIATHLLDFPIFLSVGIIAVAMGICIAAGIIAGIVPASQAARMDPVVAIRS